MADGPRVGTFCTRISPGCKNCYASVINKRFGNGLEFTVPNLERVEFFVDEKILSEPLRRKKPATIFVADMFDLFHEAISDADISYVFATMHDSPNHVFQVLTKRTERMHRFINGWGGAEPNIWAGTSVETPQYKDRIDWLRNTPAAIRFISFEPALEDYGTVNLSGIDWAIFGGESGPGARPCNLAWAENLHAQCAAQNVAFFMKQIGSNSYWFSAERLKRLGAGGDGFTRQSVKNAKGGNMNEWPEQFRVREFPVEKLVSA